MTTPARAAVWVLAAALTACGGDAVSMGPSVPFESLPEEHAAAQCDLRTRCEPEGGLPRDQCVATLAASFRATELPRIEESIARGTAAYDGAAAARCFADVRARSCDDLRAPESAACRAVLVGSIPLGGTCSVTAECAGDAYCDDAACPTRSGTCTASVPLGEACTGAVCQVGLTCRAGTCEQPAPPVGLPCGSGDRCTGLLACVDGTCVSREERRIADVGEPCDTASVFCLAGLSCVRIGPDRRECRERVSSGAPCHLNGVPNHCPDGERCAPSEEEYLGTCQPLPEIGEPCEAVQGTPSCAGTLWCFAAMCAERLPNGAPCEEDSDCRSHCRDGVCGATPLCEE